MKTKLDAAGAEGAALDAGFLPPELGGAAPGSQQIYVRADRAVRYGAFVEVGDRLQADDYRKVGLISEAL